MRKVFGIDQSYTSAGYCVVDESGAVVEFGTIKTKKEDDDIFDRASTVTRKMQEIAANHDPALIGLEGLAFSKFGNATRDLAGLQFVIITQFRNDTKFGQNMVIISPNLLKKFATGKGTAVKAEMAAAMPQQFLDEIAACNYKKTTGLYDIADAYWIAQYTLEEYKKRNKMKTGETKQP